MAPEIQMIIHALGYALLHSLWQGLLLYVVYVLLCKSLPESFARLKYNLGLFALAGTIVWTVDTFLKYWHHIQGVQVIMAESSEGGVVKTINTTVRSGELKLDVIDTLLPKLEVIFPYLVALYSIGLLWLLFRLIVSLNRVRSFRTKGIIMPSEDWQSKFQQWKKNLGITYNVNLYFSDRVSVPMMLGYFKPLVLIPIATLNGLSTEQVEAILIHELAHIKRNDYLVNILQAIVETILFFNPFVHLISAIVRKERENCVDDIVLNNIGHPISYAKALAQLQASNNLSFALAASGKKNYLLNRIKRIMEMKKYRTSGSIIPAVLIGIAISLSIMWLTPVLAQSKKDKPNKEKAAKSKTSIIIVDDNGNKKTYHSIDELPPETKKELQEKLNKAGVEIKRADKEVKESLAKVDKEIAEAQEEVSKAMKEIDWEEINDEVRTSMKEAQAAMNDIDWEEINAEVKAAMKESKKAMKEAHKAAAAVNMDSLDVVVAKAMEASRAAIAAVNFDSIGKIVAMALDSSSSALKKASIAISNAANSSDVDVRIANGKNGKVFAYSNTKNSSSYMSVDKVLSKMEKDGLIDRNYSYKVEKKYDRLYINGQLQPDAIAHKYLKYFKGDKVVIKGEKDDISIKIRN